MNYKTKKYKRIQNKKTIKNKKIGGNAQNQNSSVLDVLSQYTGKASKYIKDKSLRLMGLQTIQNANESNLSPNLNSNTLSNSVSKVGSDIANVADKSSAAIVANINDVLQNPKVGESLSDVSKESTEILENLNSKFSTPELKEETKLAMDNVADYVEIGVNAMDKPIDDAIDQLNNASSKAISGVGSGIIKVGTDLLAAVPGVGAIVEAGKIINDISTSVGNVAEAASDATTTISKVVDETSLNIDSGIKELHENKKIANQIANRTNSSIHTFMRGGGGKTKRRFFKNKKKSRRVRFAV